MSKTEQKTFRIAPADKARWGALLSEYPGKAHELFARALDALELEIQHPMKGMTPIQRVQAALSTLGNAVSDLAAQNEIARIRNLDHEKQIEALNQNFERRESELLADIHRLRTEKEELASANKNLEALQAKYDIVMRDRTDLRRRLKQLEQRKT